MKNEPKIPWNTAEILEATKGDLLCGDIKHTFEGVSIDSRTISANELFIAIKGNVYDGHSFISDLISSGVRGLIISKDEIRDPAGTDWQDKGIVCVAVSDTTKALGDLASFNRRRTDVSVVAITGSNGKTTTREMTASVVSTRYKTLSTKGNFNNEIGLPLTLLDLKNSHQWAVLELGTNRPGEIDRLGEICIPDIGVITNIGFSHLEGLGSIEGVMNAKGELLKRIKPKGTAVLNADDSRVLYLSTKTSRKVLYFGLSEDARIKALDVNETTTGISFTLVLPEEKIPIKLRAHGGFMVSNALAAASVGYIIGLSSEEIKAGLEYFQPVKGRINIFDVRGVHIIDDTYNANPDSMEAAIRILSSLKGNSRGILVAGDMLELGEHAESMHKKIGALSARSNIARLYITGEFAEAVAKGAGKEDKNSMDIFIGAREEILEDLKKSLLPGDWVLVKGSRAMGMEKIVEGLKECNTKK
ncbi:MAG: UDP-N-acetylmuramoyl-tripeptide--D-alanyl-D-alanine ligase [Desulfobacterales bacterium]|nr:UDP-N-acetylmuramoyl-tripeptide--D-alanyl-D-alanine ligase [Desulfobacterales bacterium]